MDLAQIIDGEAGVFSTPVLALDVSLKKPGEMSRAFIVAMALHLAAILLVMFAIQKWPMVTPAARQVRLELDLTSPVRPVQTAPVIPDQALVTASAELQGLVIPEAPVPEAPRTEIPEPAIRMSCEDGNPLPASLEPPRMKAGFLVGRTQPVLPPSSPVGGGGGRPIALSEIQPHYPYASRVRGEAGGVVIHVDVTSEGNVSSVSVKRSSGYVALDTSALTAARKARFKPAEKEGKAVASDMDLQFEFRLEDE